MGSHLSDPQGSSIVLTHPKSREEEFKLNPEAIPSTCQAHQRYTGRSLAGS